MYYHSSLADLAPFFLAEYLIIFSKKLEKLNKIIQMFDKGIIWHSFDNKGTLFPSYLQVKY